MATVQDVLDLAASKIGISGTDNEFNTWYWGFHCYDPNTYPWCAAYVSWVLVHAGVPCNPSASASGVATQYSRVADEDVQPGDLVVFNWDGRQDTGWCDHVGFVEWSDINDSGYFGTIEGNTGYSAEGEVARVTRYNYGSYFTAFFRPSYDGSSSGGGYSPEPDGSIDDLAWRVINGEFGNGDERRAALGDKYDAVQQRVNEILNGDEPAPEPSYDDVDDLAQRVINGEFGNGDDRRNALGDKYDAVQARVNELLGSGTGGADIEELAQAVIRGDYGNGEERRNALGSNYDAVQQRVNEILGY